VLPLPVLEEDVERRPMGVQHAGDSGGPGQGHVEIGPGETGGYPRHHINGSRDHLPPALDHDGKG